MKTIDGYLICRVVGLDVVDESGGVDMKHAVDRCLTTEFVIRYPCDLASHQLISTILSLSLSLSLSSPVPLLWSDIIHKMSWHFASCVCVGLA